jgi:hypothetical protein
MEAIGEFMKKHTFDTVIASMHFVRGHDPITGSIMTDMHSGKPTVSIYRIFLTVSALSGILTSWGTLII